MTTEIAVFGYGPAGQAIAAQLVKGGRPVRVIQRNRPQGLPEGARYEAGTLLDRDSALRAARGAAGLVCAVGLPYDGKLWLRDWPHVMTNLLAAAEALRARLILVDNLYMYGPQTAPLREDMALTDVGLKPKARAMITRQWQEWAAAGRGECAAVRASDFYGPGVLQSGLLGEFSLGRLAKGQAAQLLGNPDLPHDMTHIRDLARAVVTLLDAPADAMGQAWHVPNAPTQTARQLLTMAASAMGVEPRFSVLPQWLAPVLGLFMPIMKELYEMRFQMDRPYLVDSSKFAARFWNDPIPFDQGIPEAAKSFMR